MDVVQAAGWIAPAATMIAAVMTAANLGSRVTGWGFVVFTVGALAWMAVGWASGQRNLLFSNGFLFLVDLLGIWRWLGRRARYDLGAAGASRRGRGGALFAVGSIEGRPVLDRDGRLIAETVEAMAACDTGAIRYLVVREGGMAGVGERLHALAWEEVRMRDARVEARLTRAQLAKRRTLDPRHWPAAGERVDA